MFSKKAVHLLMGATILGLSAQAASAISLSEAVEKAVKGHPEVQMAFDNREAIRHDWEAAFGGFRPTVDLQLGTGHERSNNPTTRNRANRGDKEGHRSLWRNEAILTINQMLFDGFETDAETCQERYRYESAHYNMLETEENVALRAVQAYLDVLRTAEQLELQKENVRIHTNYVEQMRKRANSGTGSKADLRQAEGRLALTEANMLAAQGEYRKAQISYNEVVGEKPGNLSSYDSPKAGLPKNLDSAIERALENNPAIKSALADIEASKEGVRVANAAFYPRVDLELTAARQHNLDGSEDANNEYSAMTRLRYNLYNGGSDTARKNERKSRQSSAEESLKRDQRLVEENVYSAWNNLQTAKKRLAPLDAHVASADETRQAYKKQFDIGQRSLLDLLDSEVEYVNSKNARIDGKYAVDFAIFDILAQEGSLVSTLIEVKAEEPKVAAASEPKAQPTQVAEKQ